MQFFACILKSNDDKIVVNGSLAKENILKILIEEILSKKE